jgi:hypothetical protein
MTNIKATVSEPFEETSPDKLKTFAVTERRLEYTTYKVQAIDKDDAEDRFWDGDWEKIDSDIIDADISDIEEHGE